MIPYKESCLLAEQQGFAEDFDPRQSPRILCSPQFPSPKPLRIHKAPSAQQHNGKPPLEEKKELETLPKTTYEIPILPPGATYPWPPRFSSSTASTDSNASGAINESAHGRTHRREKSESHSAGASDTSRREEYRHSMTSYYSPSITTAATTVSKHLAQQAQYIPDASVGIIGNFVPLDSPDMSKLRQTAEPRQGPSEAVFNVGRVAAANPRLAVPNPYQFEPDTPDLEERRQTRLTDFMDFRHNGRPVSSPQFTQGREFQALGLRPEALRRPEGLRSMASDYENRGPPLSPSTRPIGYPLKRSESSPHIGPSELGPNRFRSESSPNPNVSPLNLAAKEQPVRSPERSPEIYGLELSPDIPSYYHEYMKPTSATQRGRVPSSPPYRAAARDLRYQSGSTAGSVHKYSHSSATSRTPSPTRHTRQNSTTDSYHSSQHGRHSGKAPTQALDNVAERDEHDYQRREVEQKRREDSPCPSPKKRSRSPMKKMFGENGWLGKTPDEASEARLRTRRESPKQKVQQSMMEKLRNKLDHLAEKADISPRAPKDGKHPKLSVLSVSLPPLVQAKMSMEAELMISHTANNFIMNQFRQGRVAVDSIKKTVDVWKAKGRPVVIEFMYDQATQRDLIAANQHNFRFHGERAGDTNRVNSMLYNWRGVANHMAVRTFCDADTVMLKLLFDIEQILEFLGAGDSMLQGLQQMRATANELMRLARQKAATGFSSQSGTPSREIYENRPSIDNNFSPGQQGDALWEGLVGIPSRARSDDTFRGRTYNDRA